MVHIGLGVAWGVQVEGEGRGKNDERLGTRPRVRECDSACGWGICNAYVVEVEGLSRTGSTGELKDKAPRPSESIASPRANDLRADECVPVWGRVHGQRSD